MPIHSSSIHHTKHSQPDWARGDFFEDDANNDESNNIYNNDLNSPSDNYFGAEHVVLLFDCNPSMFERYIPMMPDEDDVDSDEEMDTLLGIGGGGGGGTTENSSKERLLSPMEVALTAAHKLLRMRIRAVAETKSGKRNGVGVILFGCDTMRDIRGKKSEGGGESDGSEDDGDDDSEDSSAKMQSSTFELLELTPPGIDQVLKIQECLPSKSKRKKQRDLGKEFSTVEVVEGEEEMDGMVDSCPLRQALHDANKAFMKAK